MIWALCLVVLLCRVFIRKDIQHKHLLNQICGPTTVGRTPFLISLMKKGADKLLKCVKKKS